MDEINNLDHSENESIRHRKESRKTSQKENKSFYYYASLPGFYDIIEKEFYFFKSVPTSRLTDNLEVRDKLYELVLTCKLSGYNATWILTQMRAHGYYLTYADMMYLVDTFKVEEAFFFRYALNKNLIVDTPATMKRMFSQFDSGNVLLTNFKNTNGTTV